MDPLFDFSIEFTRWLQETYPQLESFFRFISQLGGEEFYLALAPLIYWCLDKRLGKNLIYIFLISLAVNSLFKHSFRGPRPYWLDNSVQMDDDLEYGVPSGHTQLASSLYLFLALWLKQRWIWVLAFLMIVAMGLSRIYLGVHFVHDVVVGFLLSLIILLGYFLWQKRLSKDFNKRILGQKLLAAFTVSLFFTLLYTIVRLIIGEPDLGVEWASYISGAELAGIEDMATAVGTLLGFGIGINLEGSRIRFKVKGKIWQLIIRYVLGIVLTIAIWAGLDQLFPADPLWAGIPLRILRYFLTLLWISYYAPYMFVRLKLAKVEPDPGIKLKM